MDGNEVREYFVIVGTMKKIKLLQEEGALLAEFRPALVHSLLKSNKWNTNLTLGNSDPDSDPEKYSPK